MLHEHVLAIYHIKTIYKILFGNSLFNTAIYDIVSVLYIQLFLNLEFGVAYLVCWKDSFFSGMCTNMVSALLRWQGNSMCKLNLTTCIFHHLWLLSESLRCHYTSQSPFHCQRERLNGLLWSRFGVNKFCLIIKCLMSV